MEDWKYNLYCSLVRNDPAAFDNPDLPPLSRNDKNTYKKQSLAFRLSDGLLEQNVSFNEEKQVLITPVEQMPDEPKEGVHFRFVKCKVKHWVRVVKASNKQAWLKKVHDEASHQGRDACLKLLKQNAYWFGMKQDLVDYIRHCDVCQRARTDYTVAPLQHIIEERPNIRWQIDLTTIAGYQGHLLVVIDVFSKFVWWKFLATKAASGVMAFLLNIIKKEGVKPRIIQSDNGGEFISESMNQITAEFGIEVIHGRPYHPQSQGNVERVNKTIKTMIYKLLRAAKENGTTVDILKLIEDVIDTYNSTSHSSTGFTPLQLQRPALRSPTSTSTREILAEQRVQLAGLYALAFRRLNAAAKKADKVHNQKYATKVRVFAVDDIVLYKIPKELRKKGQAAYDCEAKVTAVHRNSRYSLQFLTNPPPNQNRTFHANEIKKYYTQPKENLPASSNEATANETRDVDEDSDLFEANLSDDDGDLPISSNTNVKANEEAEALDSSSLSDELQDHLEFMLEMHETTSHAEELDDTEAITNSGESEPQDFVRYKPRARPTIPRTPGASLCSQFRTLSESPSKK